MTNKTITLSRELAERLGALLIRVNEQGPEYEGLIGALADPVPPAGVAPAPEYFVAACDKFDWTPEEALRFYAEGKHFDVVDGRTRILCTGAIASHALKGIGGEYADMKGMAPDGGDAEVFAWAMDVPKPGQLGGIITTEFKNSCVRADGSPGGFEHTVPLIRLSDHLQHVTRLQAEVERRDSKIDTMRRKNNELNDTVATLQSELTKALELLEHAEGAIPGGGEWQWLLDRIAALHTNQSAPADKDEECVHDFRMFSGECHKCGADWIPGKEYAPADKGQCESVACTHGIRAPHACDQCEAQNDVPDYWEDPDTGTCIDQWSKIQGLNGTEAYSIPLYRHAEQPAPVADLKALMDRHEAWKAGEANGIASMVMPDFDTWYVKNRGVIGTAIYKNERKVWNACLDEVARLNSEPKP